MVKHTQTDRRQNPMNCLSVFDQIVGLVNPFQANVLFLYTLWKHQKT